MVVSRCSHVNWPRLERVSGIVLASSRICKNPLVRKSAKRVGNARFIVRIIPTHKHFTHPYMFVHIHKHIGQKITISFNSSNECISSQCCRVYMPKMKQNYAPTHRFDKKQSQSFTRLLLVHMKSKSEHKLTDIQYSSNCY